MNTDHIASFESALTLTHVSHSIVLEAHHVLALAAEEVIEFVWAFGTLGVCVGGVGELVAEGEETSATFPAFEVGGSCGLEESAARFVDACYCLFVHETTFGDYYYSGF